MAEYMRALKLQKENCVDDALSLFSELLETEILFEVSLSINACNFIEITSIFVGIDLGDEEAHIKIIDFDQI